jgi:4-diphosphocytidyl-2-C-methyl-D-erythritol kinase
MQLESPAKINLFLRILGRRLDGYHELASLFQAIDLADILHFKESNNDILTCSNSSLAVNHDNLVFKARNLFRSKTGISQHFTIHLEKNIPIQAGLGGGSSNAATTLWGLNELCGRPASEEQLCQWSSEIGSDIPFFLSQGTAYCTGRGEILRPCISLPKQNVTIIKPQKGLSTPKVFNILKTHLLPSRDPEKALQSFYHGDPNYFNDLEIPAFELMPELCKLKQKLENSGFTTVLMSGTGSSFFCLGEGNTYLKDHYSWQTSFINREADSWY